MNLLKSINTFPIKKRSQIGKISPPLSNVEIADIEASEREFSTKKVKIFNDTNELLADLHTARAKIIKSFMVLSINTDHVDGK